MSRWPSATAMKVPQRLAQIDLTVQLGDAKTLHGVAAERSISPPGPTVTGEQDREHDATHQCKKGNRAGSHLLSTIPRIARKCRPGNHHPEDAGQAEVQGEDPPRARLERALCCLNSYTLFRERRTLLGQGFRPHRRLHTQDRLSADCPDEHISVAPNQHAAGDEPAHPGAPRGRASNAAQGTSKRLCSLPSLGFARSRVVARYRMRA